MSDYGYQDHQVLQYWNTVENVQMTSLFHLVQWYDVWLGSKRLRVQIPTSPWNQHFDSSKLDSWMSLSNSNEHYVWTFVHEFFYSWSYYSWVKYIHKTFVQGTYSSIFNSWSYYSWVKYIHKDFVQGCILQFLIHDPIIHGWNIFIKILFKARILQKLFMNMWKKVVHEHEHEQFYCSCVTLVCMTTVNSEPRR